MSPVSPPRLPEALLSRCLPPGNLGDAIIGDLHEKYVERTTSGDSTGNAVRWYWCQVFSLGLRFLLRRLVRRRLYRSLFRSIEGADAGPSKGTIMSSFSNEVRFAVRSFSKNPGLTLSAVLILGVGIGSIALMFSVLSTAVLEPLPYDDPDELVWLWGTNERTSQYSISYADLVDYQEGTTAFESLGGFTVWGDTRFLTTGDDAEQVSVGRVTANLFSTLGVQPQVGRGFVPEEEESGTETVVVLSHGLWARRFGGDPSAVGTVFSLDNQPVEVVGVMPAWFDMPSGSDLWVPIQRSARYSQDRGNNMYYSVGRLRDGVSAEQAEAQLDGVAAQIAAAYPDVKAGWGMRLVTLHERLYGSTREVLLVLLGIVSLVPIVACANIASLLLARASGRAAEMASRMALGASRARLVRQLLTENLMLALVGGAVGLGFAWVGGVALSSFAPGALPRLDDIGIDSRVLVFTLLTSLLMVPLFGMLPVLRTTDVNISQELKVGGGRGMSGATSRFQNALVVAQVALSLMLLAASGLLFRSYRNLHTQDLGFRSQNLLYAEVFLPVFKYDTYAQVQADWEQILGRLEQLPGVEAVGAVDYLPLSGIGPTNDVWALERPPADAASRSDATRRYATGDYFEIMGIPFVAGRPFEHGDVGGEDADPPVVVNEALARHFFPGEDALGRTLVFDYDVIRNLEIIGIVADVKEGGDPASAPQPTFYLPSRWRPRLSQYLVFRAAVDAAHLTEAFRGAVQAVDHAIPAPDIGSWESRLDDRLFQPQFRTVLVGSFSLVTLILSAVGLYGVLSFFAQSRRREMAIRVALGAHGTTTAALVFQRGMLLVGTGILAGLGGGLVGSRVIRGWLFQVGTMDPFTLGGVTAFLVVVGCTACLLPSLRAMTVNPVEVLKEE